MRSTKKIHERWFVLCRESKTIRYGHTKDHAIFKHRLSGNGKNYAVYKAVSTVQFSPPTRYVKKEDAYLAIHGDDVQPFNCQIEKVFDSNQDGKSL